MPSRRPTGTRGAGVGALVGLACLAGTWGCASAYVPAPEAGPAADPRAAPLDGGVASDAPPATVFPPDAPGPYPVSRSSHIITREDREIPVEVYQPDGAAEAPLVVFLPGFQLEAAFYAPLLERLASHGLLVLGVDPPAGLFSVDHVEMALDALAVVAWARAADGLFASAVHPDRLAFAGHSLGGKVAVMAAHRSGSAAAVLGLDPVNGAGPGGYTEARPDIVPTEVEGLTAALGFLGETTNAEGGAFGMACAPREQNFQTFFEAALDATRAYAWEVVGADPMDFVWDADACGVVCSACPDGPAEDDAVRAIASTLATAFLRRWLGGEVDLEAWLSGGAVPEGVAVSVGPAATP